jgi:hypothetical protein
MIVPAYLGSQSTKSHSAGWTCCFFTSFYLESYIWPDAILWWIQQKTASVLCKFKKKFDGGPCQWLDKHLGKKGISHTRKVQTHREWKGWDRWRAKSGACSSFPLTYRRVFTKNSPWQAKQPIPHTTVTFYGDCENVRRLHPKLWRQKNWLCCITTTQSHTSFFTMDFFLPKPTWLSSPPTLLFSFHSIEDKTDTI